MSDQPILFSAPMVRALLDGRKTQTRRALNPRPRADARYAGIHYASDEPNSWFFNSPRGPMKVRERYEAGDRLWVRETFSGDFSLTGTPPRDWSGGGPIWYWADGDPQDGDWTKPKPGIHMPRWASRLTLHVEDVKVERLQDISEEDALAEGIDRLNYPETGEWGWPQRRYRDVWNAINGPDAWEANPWVVAITFRVERANIGTPSSGIGGVDGR